MKGVPREFAWVRSWQRRDGAKMRELNWEAGRRTDWEPKRRSALALSGSALPFGIRAGLSSLGNSGLAELSTAMGRGALISTPWTPIPRALFSFPRFSPLAIFLFLVHLVFRRVQLRRHASLQSEFLLFIRYTWLTRDVTSQKKHGEQSLHGTASASQDGLQRLHSSPSLPNLYVRATHLATLFPFILILTP